MAPADAEPTPADQVVLERAAYPEDARRADSQGDCLVTFEIGEDGAVGSTAVANCPEKLVGATKDAAARSTFPAEPAPDGTLTRSYEVVWPFRTSNGLGHDWVLSAVAAGYGWCAYCADGGFAAEDALEIGFGRRSDALLWSATVGTRAGGLDVGGSVTLDPFWQSWLTPALHLGSSMVLGEADLPTYHSLRPMGGFVLHTTHPDGAGFGWSLEILGGADVRLGWRYYRELRPVVQIALQWILRPAGGAKAVWAANTPRMVSVTPVFVPDPVARLPDDGPPAPVRLPPDAIRPVPAGMVHLDSRMLAAAGLCRVQIDVGADGVPTRVETLSCPPVFAGPVEDAVLESRYPPFIDPATGLPAAVEFESRYSFPGGVLTAP